jgi:hypothetical protein
LACVSIAPFGIPVVPPVYCSTASCSRGSLTGCSTYLPSLSSSAAKLTCRSSRAVSTVSLPAFICAATASGDGDISAMLPTMSFFKRVLPSIPAICGYSAARSSVNRKSVRLSAILCSSTLAASSGE